MCFLLLPAFLYKRFKNRKIRSSLVLVLLQGRITTFQLTTMSFETTSILLLHIPMHPFLCSLIISSHQTQPIMFRVVIKVCPGRARARIKKSYLVKSSLIIGIELAVHDTTFHRH